MSPSEISSLVRDLDERELEELMDAAAHELSYRGLRRNSARQRVLPLEVAR